jgi:hypothetical protein
MSNQSIIIDLPENVYIEYKRRADHTNRTVEVEIAETLTRDLGETEDEGLSPELKDLINQLGFLDTKHLIRLATKTFPKKDAARIEAYHFKEQSVGLNNQESLILAELMNKFDRWFVLRNEALGLLLKIEIE